MAVEPIFAWLDSTIGASRLRAHDALKLTDAERDAGVTPVNYAYAPRPEIDVARYGVLPDGVDHSADLARAQLVAIAMGGATLIFSGGTYRFDSQIVMYTYVDFRGVGKYATIFDFHIANSAAPSNIGIDARGSGLGGFPADRKIFKISHLTLDFQNSGNQVKGLALGWNMRSMPLLESVRIRNTADWGVGFLDQNWNISFYDVEVDTCGTIVSNSSGWFKDPAVDAGTFNYINWVNCITESCGSSSSAAGGMNLQTTTANRGYNFTNCEWEDNRGTDQVLITKASGIVIIALYIEMPTGAVEAVTGIELSGCSGIIEGGFLTAADANNDQALQIKGNSDIEVRGVHFGSAWNVTEMDIQASLVRTGHNLRAAGSNARVALDSAGQVFGEIRPRVSAHKNGTDQTGIVTATPTKVTFGTELFDETATYASSTFTPKTIGEYQIDCAVTLKTAVDQTRMILMLYANGAAFKSVIVQASGTGSHTLVGSWLVNSPATNTTWEIYVRQDSGSNKDISGATDETYFMATLVERR